MDKAEVLKVAREEGLMSPVYESLVSFKAEAVVLAFAARIEALALERAEDAVLALPSIGNGAENFAAAIRALGEVK